MILLASNSYPDSVNLVRPPNTTIPKTLIALPMSQYPTPLGLDSGQAFFAAVAVSEIVAADRTDIDSAMFPTGLIMVASA